MNCTNFFEHSNRKNNINHFGNLVNLAFVDGEFTSEEFEVLSKFSEKLGLTQDERNMVLDTPEKFTLQTVNPVSKRISYIYDFFKMIYADHRLDESEYHLVIKYAEQLGFNHVEAKMIVNKSVELFENNISEEDYEILVLKK